MKKVLFSVTVLLLVAAFGISAFMVGNYVIEGKKQEELNDKLSEIVASAQNTTAAPTEAETTKATEETTQSTEPTEGGGILPGYQEIYDMNNDTVGWLTLPGTKLDYAVMQTPDRENYYLYRDFNKQENKRGSIYAREVCDINKPSDNITIYGHNMADGSMFAALNSYVNKSAWENNSLIIFNTLTEYHTYKIFAVFKTSANIGEGFSYHKFVDAENEQEFNDFVSTCKDLAFYDTGITPVYGDKMICLSTCEYTLSNGRLVVAAVRIT